MSRCTCPACDADARRRREADRAEGLHRIGVAVAIWGAMAVARRDPSTPSERVAYGMVRVLRTLLADTEADLAAERAARRKWELRLRWRRTHRRQRNADLLHARLKNEFLRVRNLVTPLSLRELDYYYLAGPNHIGPRGVLP